MSFLIWTAVVLIAMVIGAIAMRAHVADSLRRKFHKSNMEEVLAIPKGKWLTLPISIGVPALIAVYLFHAIYVISPGHVGVPVWFGNVQEISLSEGVKFVNPMANVIVMDGRRFAYEFSDETSLVSVSKNQNPLTIEVAFPINLNPSVAWKIYQKIGDDSRYRDQLRSAARSAVRSAAAEYKWAEVTGNLNQIAAKMGEYFSRNVTRDLVNLGFTEAEAGMAFTFLDVQLRKIVPDERILNATAEKLAAIQDLERQITLTAIAKEVANRREMEGMGVRKLFSALPTDFNANEVSTILNALANKERADAMLKAVENGEVKIIVMGGSAAPAINVD